MLCRICRHCGLCEGDGSFPLDKSIVVNDEVFSSKNIACAGAKNNEVALVFDIGTTTIALAVIHLKTGKKVYSIGELNAQVAFGTDVIARIAFASSENGEKNLNKILKNQLSKMIRRVIGEIQILYAKKWGRIECTKIVICGNTAMECFARGVSVLGLSHFPFSVPDNFGYEIHFSQIFDISVPVSPECTVLFAPVIGPFIGGDAVCAMLSCFFSDKIKENAVFLADVGTNCEIAVFLKSQKKIICTSSAAGPAFEGQGISCGMTASNGAIARVYPDKKSPTGFCCSVIGGEKAKGICGSGLLEAASSFYANGTINSNGTFKFAQDKVELIDGICLTQNDLRQFQLAKAAIQSALLFLKTKSNENDCGLFLAGGFGSVLSSDAALATGMIPENTFKTIVQAGNAALSGAILLLNDEWKNKATEIVKMSKWYDLAEEKNFQELYISSLQFP